MLALGTSRPRSVLCGPTSNASTVAATTRATATRTSCLWTTACRAFWDSGWTCLRTSKWIMTSGWSGRFSPNLFPGKNCYSENQQLSTSSYMKWNSFNLECSDWLTTALCYMFCTDWKWRMDGRAWLSVIITTQMLYVMNYSTLMPPTVF